MTNLHLQEIGKITVNFAFLEDVISFFVWTWISKDQTVGQIITAELSFRNLIALLSSIFRHRTEDSEKVKMLDALLKRALQLEEKRNIITHSVWAGGKTPDTDTITRVKRSAKIYKGLRHQFEQIGVADLNKIAKEIAVLAEEIQTFMIDQMEANSK